MFLEKILLKKEEEEMKKRSDREIPAEYFEFVRTRVGILEVFQKLRIRTKESRRFCGVAARAICPFHKGRSPSMSLRLDRNFYNCFGCGRSGDVFSFIARFFGNKTRAFRWLKKNFDIPLPWETFWKKETRTK